MRCAARARCRAGKRSTRLLRWRLASRTSSQPRPVASNCARCLSTRALARWIRTRSASSWHSSRRCAARAERSALSHTWKRWRPRSRTRSRYGPCRRGDQPSACALRKHVTLATDGREGAECRERAGGGRISPCAGPGQRGARSGRTTPGKTPTGRPRPRRRRPGCQHPGRPGPRARRRAGPRG